MGVCVSSGGRIKLEKDETITERTHVLFI